MLYVCVQKFDVTGNLEKSLGTKQGETNKRQNIWINSILI